jgi:NAD(P)-dependent dehydrogenase (short-subunit alcohol dehydrogenase family)
VHASDLLRGRVRRFPAGGGKHVVFIGLMRMIVDMSTVDRSGPVRRATPQPMADRVALVSDGDRGPGLRVVRLLAGQGMRVVLASRSAERGRATIDSLGDLAGRVAVRQLDTADPASVARLASWVADRLGRCDVLVNSPAGPLDGDRGTDATVDLDVARHCLETNLIGTWRLTQAIAPLMRAGRYGRIVNLTSLPPTRRGVPGYRVSTAAVIVLTLMLADELADGILVNACCPDHAYDDGRRGAPAPLPATRATPVWLATLPDDGPTGGFYRWRALLSA